MIQGQLRPEVSTSLEPSGHPLFDLLVGDQLPGIRLLESPLDFCQQQETLHGILNGSIFGQSLNHLDHFFFGRHDISIAILSSRIKPAHRRCWCCDLSKGVGQIRSEFRLQAGQIVRPASEIPRLWQG